MHKTYIKVKDLLQFVASEAYLQSKVLPISRLRAESQARNPRAQPDDVALIVHYEGDQVMAYIGALPDLYFPPSAPPMRIVYLSCMWVSPTLRGRGTAVELLREMAACYEDRSFVTGFVPGSLVLYQRVGYYREWNTPTGFRGFLRPNMTAVLVPKGGKWIKLRPLLRWLDRISYPINEWRLRWRAPVSVPVYPAVRFDEEMAAFVQTQVHKEYHRRDAEVLNWILTYPWVVEKGQTDMDLAVRYYFTSVADVARYHLFNIRNKAGAITGIVLLFQRDGHLKLISAHLTPEALAPAARAIVQYAIRQKADRVTVFHQELAQFMADDPNTHFFHRRALQNRYLVCNLFELSSAQCFQDGDGDAAFT